MDLLLLVAVLPAAFLLYQVYKCDPVEKEPGKLLVILLVLGAVSTIPAIVLEMIGSSTILGHWHGSQFSFLFVENFIVIALVEEACKFVFLNIKTWRSTAFDYIFDGIVYAVFVSLGFAIAENIMYVFQYGFITGIMRAFTAIPGHCLFAVFMGYFYGQAKYAAAHGMNGAKTLNLVSAIGVAVILHGTYDFLASVDDGRFLLAFYVFLIAMAVVGYKLVKRESKLAKRVSDALPGQGAGFNGGMGLGADFGFGDEPNEPKTGANLGDDPFSRFGQ